MKKIFVLCCLLLSSTVFAERFVITQTKTQNNITANINLTVHHWGLGLGRIEGEIYISDPTNFSSQARYTMHYNQHYLSTQSHTLYSHDPENFPEISLDLTLDTSVTFEGQKIYISLNYEGEDFNLEHNMLANKKSPVADRIPGPTWLAPSQPKQANPSNHNTEKGCWMCSSSQRTTRSSYKHTGAGWRGH